MAAGPHGRVGGRSNIVPLGVLVGLAVAACTGGGADVAEGIDAERSGVASMDQVVFVDVAAEAGLDFQHGAFRWGTEPDPVAMMGGGLCWIDYDADGWLDLFVVNTWSNGEWGEWRSREGIPTNHLFRNEAGRFSDVTDDLEVAHEVRGIGCVAADLDLDGWTDLYVTTERENLLLWNDEGRGFLRDADLEVPSGIEAFGWHTGAAVGDIDGNGWPDLFVAGYTDMNRPIVSATKGFPNTHEPEPDLLFLNEGPRDGARAVFREAATEVGIEPDGPDYALGAIFSDLDRDGDLDLYVAHDTSPNQLYDNASDGGTLRLVERGVAAGVGDTGAGMGVASADVDGDQLPELVTTNQLNERSVLVRNTTASAGPIVFVDAREVAGVPDFGVGRTSWGTTWTDADLDGDVDLFVANGSVPVRDTVADRQRAQLFETREDGSLHDVSEATGLEAVGPLLGRGLATADYDNDGDLDVAIGTIGGDLALLRNTGAGGNWLTVAFPFPIPGATVTAHLTDGRILRRELIAGSSYASSEDPRAHFGLGAVSKVAELVIGIPGRPETRLRDVQAGQILEIDPNAE